MNKSLSVLYCKHLVKLSSDLDNIGAHNASSEILEVSNIVEAKISGKKKVFAAKASIFDLSSSARLEMAKIVIAASKNRNNYNLSLLDGGKVIKEDSDNIFIKSSTGKTVKYSKKLEKVAFDLQALLPNLGAGVSGLLGAEGGFGKALAIKEFGELIDRFCDQVGAVIVKMLPEKGLIASLGTLVTEGTKFLTSNLPTLGLLLAGVAIQSVKESGKKPGEDKDLPLSKDQKTLSTGQQGDTAPQGEVPLGMAQQAIGAIGQAAPAIGKAISTVI